MTLHQIELLCQSRHGSVGRDREGNRYFEVPKNGKTVDGSHLGDAAVSDYRIASMRSE
jgi:hypothetical protein